MNGLRLLQVYPSVTVVEEFKPKHHASLTCALERGVEVPLMASKRRHQLQPEQPSCSISSTSPSFASQFETVKTLNRSVVSSGHCSITPSESHADNCNAKKCVGRLRGAELPTDSPYFYRRRGLAERQPRRRNPTVRLVRVDCGTIAGCPASGHGYGAKLSPAT